MIQRNPLRVLLPAVVACLVTPPTAESAPAFPIVLRGEWCDRVYNPNDCGDVLMTFKADGTCRVGFRDIDAGQDVVADCVYEAYSHPTAVYAIGDDPVFYFFGEVSQPGCLRGQFDLDYDGYGYFQGTIAACI